LEDGEMALQPGLLIGDEFLDDDCMAKFMEEAMPEPNDPEDSGKKGRREFLIALSTGIINYLKEHDGDSFVVRVQDGGTTLEGTLEIK
jgi:hypothetical protein